MHITVDGEIEIHPKQFVSKQIFWFGVFEPLETRIFKELVKPGMVVFDVGANIGQYTLLAAKQVGTGGGVYAFEPASENYDLLERNIKRNGLTDRVILSKIALASAQGVGMMVLNKDGGSNYIEFPILYGSEGGKQTEKIELTTLDYFVERNHISRLDIIKLDVEGADFEVLKGARRVLNELHPILFVECAARCLRRFGATPRDILSYLKALNYKPYKFTKSGLRPLKGTDDISNTNLMFSRATFT